MSTAHLALSGITLVAVLLAQFSPGETPRATAIKQIRTAKTIYFDDQTHVAASVGEKARTELKKWGRYKIVEDRTQADLILLFFPLQV